MQSNTFIEFAVVGGGAAGFMGAIKAAEDGVRSVFIFEATTKTLEKVRISGGGRCNVTNACWDPSELVTNYPRGEMPLIGAFSRFATGDAFEWFQKRGVKLIIEEDGRIFPQSNTSKEVISCLHNSAEKAGVIQFVKKSVKEVKVLGEKGFFLKCKDESVFHAKKVLIATGGSPSGKKLAAGLGHQVIPPVPSLFGFKITSPWLNSCSGISIDNVKLKLICSNHVFKEEGRILITHRGLSGPAILKLSAFAARQLYSSKYKASLEINWVNKTDELIRQLLNSYRINYPSIQVKKIYPFSSLPKRLWLSFLNQCNISSDIRWSSLSKSKGNLLSESLTKNSHLMKDRGPFGEEFVTAGGVSLNEVNFQSMESTLCRGLYFAGEVLDVDGVTGGFNFQHCWTSGWIAGGAIAKDLIKSY